MAKEYETVIGLEVHVELATKTKIFCGCSTAFGGEPNTHTCPVCTGMPGSLPVLNKRVLEYAVAVGLATNCEITQYCKFDRKNYFYPDNPQNYQISQLYLPICRNGKVEIETPIVTGNMMRRRATPEGVYYVYAKQKNRILRGPGYASHVNYWMPVKGGVGIHDALWRDEFGGEIYKKDGSHGCINLPLEAAEKLYGMIEVGVPVVMYYEEEEP